MALNSRGPVTIYLRGLITKLRNSNDQIKSSHLNWENGAIVEKPFIVFFLRNCSSSKDIGDVSAVKALKLFQLWGTSHGYSPSLHAVTKPAVTTAWHSLAL